MSVRPNLSALVLCLLTLHGLGIAQLKNQETPAATPPNIATTDTDEPSDTPDILALEAADDHGLNAGIAISSLHDSITGWATLATPVIGYSFNGHFNVDATVPIYFYRLAESLSSKPKPDARLVVQRAELGDVVLGLHSAFSPKLTDYELTGLVAAPTGDEIYGLTSGRVTFDINNHFERSFGRITPSIEIGMGNSSTLANRLVTKNYTSLGPLAHFQVGLGTNLIHNISFESDAYEQLPVGDQKIYGPSRHGKATIVTGHNITEDNGFTNSLDIPLDRHTTFTTYYSRSLRIHTDTVAVGISYILRGTPSPDPPDTPLDDLFP
ncbi:hypothetical protein [Granulicella arctica]|uniref:Uncharacterized protein n=1 Tax=Granulicella arctica TaxID=940613 RepID=A0A7Y9PK12_9BACT|nr:hypothetical protein [Granulicella arctica]NYF81272.1 hypothetical protein [Granulicella arctica]